MASHDVVWNIFVTIVKGARFHVSRKQIHVFHPFPPTLQSSHRQIDIMLLIDGVCMLANIIIFDLTWVDLVLCVALFRGVVMIIATKAKDNFYHNWFPADMFLPLAIKVFKFLH
jgi:hypothetical protein